MVAITVYVMVIIFITIYNNYIFKFNIWDTFHEGNPYKIQGSMHMPYHRLYVGYPIDLKHQQGSGMYDAELVEDVCHFGSTALV